MAKAIVILGAGEGISKAVAQRFGREGFQIVLAARNPTKLATLANDLQSEGLTVSACVLDVADTQQCIDTLRSIEGLAVILYNAFSQKTKNILDEDVESLVQDFRINAGGILTAVKAALPQLEQNQGSVLITGGGLSNYPNQHVASLSIGKAASRNLTGSLVQALKPKGVYVGTIIVSGMVSPQSEVHNPANIANLFWGLHHQRNRHELVL